ncbi:MAG TPA: MFS transporter, partial [Pseudonocardia sp.]|uniref:MFS transporter n=1 Tax=Pseudonocardia sp. TaxID=60912 RepID=UPI002CA3A548
MPCPPGGAVLMAVEHAEGSTGNRRRGLFGSFPQIGSPAGMLLASGTFAAVRGGMDRQAFLEWGWRVPFLVSLVLVGVGLAIRLSLSDAPVYQRAKQRAEIARRP